MCFIIGACSLLGKLDVHLYKLNLRKSQSVCVQYITCWVICRKLRFDLLLPVWYRNGLFSESCHNLGNVYSISVYEISSVFFVLF